MVSREHTLSGQHPGLSGQHPLCQPNYGQGVREQGLSDLMRVHRKQPHARFCIAAQARACSQKLIGPPKDRALRAACLNAQGARDLEVPHQEDARPV